MFNATGQGTLFGNAQSQNLFGQAQNQQTGFFGNTNSNVNGTTVKYVPFNGTDTVQRNNQAVSVQTKLNCISAMKEYECKSLEELRYEDYSANRINPPKAQTPGIFGTNQSSPGLFNNQTSMFQSNSPFSSTQQTTLGSGTQNTLFGANTQTNAFGSKNLFGGATTSTNSAFGSFNNQSKPGTLFGMNNNTANKPLFGSTQPTQSNSLFGTSQQSSASLFGNQTQTQFGGLSQQSQPTGLFNSNTSSGSFAFQAPSSTGLFGNNNTSKPFGATNSNFSFSNSNAPVNPSLFGTTVSSGGLFSQNSTNNAFGNSSKTSLFSTPVSSTTQNLFPQQSTVFGQTNNLFGNPAKTNTSPFGTTSAFNNQQKPTLFGANTNASRGFAPANNSLFGNFGTSNQPFNSTVTTSTIAPANNSYQIGITTPAEAAYQQQVMQQKILSLVSNRPYGVNKLFMGQNFTDDTKITATEASTNNTNLLSLAIKRNEIDKIGTNQRRRILNNKTKVVPNHLYKVFSGFDEDEDTSTKSNAVDNFFFTKREDWKYLPPAAFEKSRKSINAHNSSTNQIIPNDKPLIGGISSPICTVSQFMKDTNRNYCSTPLSENSTKKTESIQTSPIHNGKSSPIHYNSSKRNSHAGDEELFNQSNDNKQSFVMNKNLTKTNESVENFSILETNSHNEAKEETKNSNIKIDGQEKISKTIDDKNCMVTLSKDGYYIAPTLDILNRLVTINEHGDKECWVENFIIGRKDYGSIRFPGHTDVYGLCLDNLVDIQRKEVSVYPDDDSKPDVGEGLNKLAQVSLSKVWPVDKSSGESIHDEKRLKIMNFEEKLKRSTERLGAKFVSYSPEKGTWVFDVNHFSKYTFLDSDEEDNIPVEQKSNNHGKSMKQEAKKSVESPKISTTNVVLAEADSMSNVLLFQKSAFDKFLNPSNTKNVLKMKQTFYNYDSEEETYNNNSIIDDSKNNFPFQLRKNELKIDRDQPKSKKFESCEMGETIFMSSQNNSQMDCSNSNLVLLADDRSGKNKDDRRPIKPLTAEQVAPTLCVRPSNQSDHNIHIPNHLRDLRSLKMPYLFMKIANYLDNVTYDMHKKYPNNMALIQGNRFRVGFNVTRDSMSHGLKFFQVNNVNDNLTTFKASLKKMMPNSLMIMKCNYSESLSTNTDYKNQLMDASLSVAECLVSQDNKCPLWGPSDGLDVLNCYLKAHNHVKNDTSLEKVAFERIIRLCSALWNDIGNEQKNFPPFIHDLGRKQLFSKWIKMESREKLMKQAESLLKSPSGVDVDKCNTVILNALCSGEISLACQLAIATNQHRMSLLIAQSASDVQGREVIREQLNLWLQTRTDEHMPSNILCIYMILSGQTSLIMSSGSILAPFKELSWVQTLGSHFWYVQPYLGSIKSAVDLYDDAFKTELDIPSPYPISPSESQHEDDEYPYYDCCYHLIKLYCDRLYDLDVLLNPPTISRHNSHKLSWDWSASWHLANILTSLGFSRNIPSKISSEFAAQLEREGLWKMAVFVLLHISDENVRRSLVKNLINRHISETKIFTAEEQFLVDRLKIPIEWIYEAKAIYCKSIGNVELEASHWLKANQFDKSHQLYIDEIVPDLLINDKFDKIKDIFYQFMHVGADKTMTNWPTGGELYLKYIHIVSSLRTFKLTNKLANHSFLMDGDFDMDNVYESDDFSNQINRLRLDVSKLSKAVEGFKVNSDSQSVCKQQILSICSKFHDACSNEIV